jgi:ATP:corrinoid adenosyltransferase
MNWSRNATLALVLSLLWFLVSAAGEWERSFDLGLAVTQSNYSDSWTGGEAGAIIWVLNANLYAERQLSAKTNWANTLKLSFGQSHIQDKDTKEWARPEKSSDRIFLESIMRLTMGGYVDPYFAFTFESQFLDASVSEIKRYLNPMLLTESAGVIRVFKDTETSKMTSRLGLALRQHLDNTVVSIVPEEKKMETTTDGGLEWVTDFNHTFSEGRMNYVTKLRFFQAFYNSKSDELEAAGKKDYWKATDLAWENTLSAAVSKYIQVSLFLELLYDKEIDKRGRFRQTLALGLTYKMF